MNNCIFYGRFVRDPELRRTAKGTAVCTFTLAVNEGYGDNQTTVYPKFQCWNKQAEFVAEHGKKGMQAVVESRYTQNSYTDKDGKTVKTHEFVVRDIRIIFDGKGFGQKEFEPKETSMPMTYDDYEHLDF